MVVNKPHPRSPCFRPSPGLEGHISIHEYGYQRYGPPRRGQRRCRRRRFRKHRTPGTPNMHLVRPTTDEDKVGEEDQALYRAGVGMLLFCVKHTRLDIMNPVRELSKMLGVATVAAMKEMRRIIKHVLDTMTLGLKMEPKLCWNEEFNCTRLSRRSYERRVIREWY